LLILDMVHQHTQCRRKSKQFEPASRMQRRTRLAGRRAQDGQDPCPRNTRCARWPGESDEPSLRPP
jgi:hypothetical protein